MPAPFKKQTNFLFASKRRAVSRSAAGILQKFNLTSIRAAVKTDIRKKGMPGAPHYVDDDTMAPPGGLCPSLFFAWRVCWIAQRAV